MDDVQARLDALSPEQRARLERALLARRTTTVGDQIRPRDEPAAVLSSAQQRLWFFDRLMPGAPTYNAVVASWLTGPLDADLLARAFAGVVARHEVLRSVIEVPDGGDEPVQRPLPDWDLPVGRHTVDPSLPPEERRAAALVLARDLARRAYDLERELPIRADLVELGADEWLLVVSEHHIAFDGWSDEILFGEVSSHYAAVASGRDVPPPPALPVQYADYATWEQSRLARGDLAGHAEFWRCTLAGAPPVAALPLDRPRPPVQVFEGRHLDLHMDHADQVRALRTRCGATDFMVLVAAWAATLYRWSGETDLVLGTPMANRNRVELEPLIGFFSNTVPLRVRIDPNAGFGDLVERVRTVALEAFDHQDLPFDLIVEAASPQRVPGANPLFSVNVRVQSAPPPQLDLPGVEARHASVDLGFSRFDLAVEMQMARDHVGGYLEYNEALLDETTAEELRQRLDQLLGAALADPATPLWKLPQPERVTRRQARRRSAVPAAQPAATHVVVARLPRPPRLPEAEVHVHWFDLSRPTGPGSEESLSDDERSRAFGFRFERDRTRFVRRRVHLRRLLGSLLDRDPEGLTFVTGPYGRPTLDGAGDDWQFTTSSSGDLAVVALSRHPLGVDVEQVVPSDADRDVAGRMFATEEASVLASAPEADFARLFFACWTRKEAYVKATGLGLSYPLGSFAVELDDVAAPRLLRSSLRPDDVDQVAVRTLRPPASASGGGATAALVVAHRDPLLTTHVHG